MDEEDTAALSECKNAGKVKRRAGGLLRLSQLHKERMGNKKHRPNPYVGACWMFEYHVGCVDAGARWTS